MFEVEQGVVSSLVIGNDAASEFTVRQLITGYGTPDTILIHASPSFPGPSIPFFLVLLYEDRRFVAIYDFAARVVDLYLLACPGTAAPLLTSLPPALRWKEPPTGTSPGRPIGAVTSRSRKQRPLTLPTFAGLFLQEAPIRALSYLHRSRSTGTLGRLTTRWSHPASQGYGFRAILPWLAGRLISRPLGGIHRWHRVQDDLTRPARTQKALRDHSTLKDHKRHGKRLTPPFATLPNSNPPPGITTGSRNAWAALLLSRTGRDAALEFFRQLASSIHQLDAADRPHDITQRGLSGMEPHIRDTQLPPSRLLARLETHSGLSFCGTFPHLTICDQVVHTPRSTPRTPEPQARAGTASCRQHHRGCRPSPAFIST